MDQPLPMGPMNGPGGGPPNMGPGGPPMPPVSGVNVIPPPPGTPGSQDGFPPPSSMSGGDPSSGPFGGGPNSSNSANGNSNGGGDVPPSRPSPSDDFTPNSSTYTYLIYPTGRRKEMIMVFTSVSPSPFFQI